VRHNKGLSSTHEDHDRRDDLAEALAAEADVAAKAALGNLSTRFGHHVDGSKGEP
jgi:hypothetical protein